jgi:membrane-associated phospholipid phosphatase
MELDPAVPARAALRFGYVTLAACLTHLAFCLHTGLRPEHLVLDGFFIGLPWISDGLERFTKAAFPIWLTAVMVDCQRFLHVLGRVHTDDVYLFDARLFPAGFTTHPLAWAERLNAHPHVALDFLCGLAYLLFIAELVGVGVYLYWKGQKTIFEAVTAAFFLANLVGVLTWLFFPVAPPWYIIDHGFGPAIANPVASAAGTARFDALLHIHFFRDFYGRNPNIYGAMPSLHVAYPTIATWYAWRRGWLFRGGTLIFTLFMGFSAVYLAHHYVVDVLAGYATALLACAAADRWVGISSRAVQLHKVEVVSA